jgi:glycerophosphoryl diester phosphodiesterase
MLKFLFFIFVLTAISCSPLIKYQKLPEVIAWEKDIEKFEQQDKSESDPDNAILFAGSSSIRLWSSIRKDMAPYPVIQRGFGGAKLSDLAVYSERIISPHLCKAIVMFIANDISGTDKDKSPEEVAKLFRILIKSIRKTHPETPVFWIAITPTKARWEVWPQARKANELIKQYCENQNNTYFIDTENEFLNESGHPREELFVDDLLHLNQNGYALWSSIIKRELIKVISPGKVEIIAHRGASYLAPENTVASAKLAWELGADGVEADIYLSKDNKIMVNHDATTLRTSGKNFIIKDTFSDTLRTLDAGSFKSTDYKGEKIPFLEEIIKTVPKNKELVIEIKCKSEVLPYLKEVIGNSGKDIKFVFISFDFNTITDTKKAFPENSCYWLCSNSELLSKNIGFVSDAGLEGISLSYQLIDEKTALLARKLKLELFSWTVDDPDEAKRLISLGVKGITTNRPGWLNEQIFNPLPGQ